MTFAASLARWGFERVVYLGGQEFKGLAREAALKMLELSDGKVVASAETPLGFRQARRPLSTARHWWWCFCRTTLRAAVRDGLLRELRTDGVGRGVVALTQVSGRHGVGRLATGWSLRCLARPPRRYLGLCFPYAVFAQTFAFLQSLGARDSP